MWCRKERELRASVLKYVISRITGNNVPYCLVITEKINVATLNTLLTKWLVVSLNKRWRNEGNKMCEKV